MKEARKRKFSALNELEKIQTNCSGKVLLASSFWERWAPSVGEGVKLLISSKQASQENVRLRVH